MDIVNYNTNIYYLTDNDIVEIRSEGEQESLFIVERTEKSSEESGEQAIPETYISTDGNTDGTKRRRKDGNYARKCWNPL